MSDFTHCDECKEIIDKDQERLVVRMGRAKDSFVWMVDEGEAHDYCLICVRQDPILVKLWEKAKEDAK